VISLERDPAKTTKNDYFRHLKIRKFKPKFTWYRCECCGQEYKGETMYECTDPSIMFTWPYYYRGCINCFINEDQFRQWLTENDYILSEDDFDDPKNWKRLIR
jgi:hypothetical protein